MENVALDRRTFLQHAARGTLALAGSAAFAAVADSKVKYLPPVRAITPGPKFHWFSRIRVCNPAVLAGHTLRVYFLMSCTLVLAGCAQPQSVIARRSGQCRSQIRVQDIGTAETMALAEEVLGQMNFTVEKTDVQSGLMRTRPLSGAQFFEFWRSDNVGPDNSLQANLHTIRRTVELEISRQGKELCIACSVRVQRLSLPERQVSSTARAYEMFSRSSSTLQRLALNPQQQKNMAWIDLDKDVPLAEEILRRIESCCVLRAAERRTQNAERQTQNAERQTQNAERRTENET